MGDLGARVYVFIDMSCMSIHFGDEKWLGVVLNLGATCLLRLSKP